MSDPLIGTALGGYEILSKLGAGGMGAVYKGRNPRVDKIVAIKVLPAHVAGRPDFLERFRREARLAAKLDHPNIVTVYDSGEDRNILFFVMKYVEGESLSGRLKRRPRMPLPEVIEVITEIARGLERAHREGLVHRDIKPDNIMISRDGQIMITDFGLVKQSDSEDGGLTNTGTLLGTPYYMAPEQCEGMPDIDGRADLYALGLIFYNMVTGQVPVEGKTPLQIIHNRITKDIAPPRALNPQLPPAVDELIMQLLTRDRAQRFPTAALLIERLKSLSQQVSQDSSLMSSFEDETIRQPRPPILDTPTPISSPSLSARPASGTITPGPTQAQPVTGVSAASHAPPGPLTQAQAPGSKLVPVLLVLLCLTLAGLAALLLGPGALPQAAPRIVEMKALPEATREGEVEVFGRLDRGPALVFVNGREVSAGSDGSFLTRVPLKEGLNRISVRPQDATEANARSFEVQRDTIPPRLLVDGADAEGRVTLGPDRRLRVTVQESQLARFEAGGEPYEVTGGVVELVVPPGQESLRLIARDRAGNLRDMSLSLIADLPLELVEAPNPPAMTREAQVTLRGKLSDPEAALLIQGQRVEVDGDGGFAFDIELAEGTTSLRLAVSRGERRLERQWTIVCDRTAPKLDITGTRGDGDERRLVCEPGARIEGRLIDRHPSELLVDGAREPFTQDGAFTLRAPALDGPLRWRIVARDQAGNVRELSLVLEPRRELALSFERSDGAWTREARLDVHGLVQPPKARLLFRGETFDPGPDGAFCLEGIALVEGENRVRLVARSGDQELTGELRILRDSTPPVIRLLNCAGDALELREPFVLEGLVIETHLASLTLAGEALAVKDGRFTIALDPERAPEELFLVARDEAGNDASRLVKVSCPAMPEPGREPGSEPGGDPGKGPSVGPEGPPEAADALAVLATQAAWRAASKEQQKAAAMAVKAKLGPTFTLKGFGEYDVNGQSFRIATFTHSSAECDLQLVPGGSFEMGSDAGNSDEKPRHEVNLRPFLIGRHELSQGSWTTRGGRVSGDIAAGALYPIANVTWKQVTDWLRGVGDGFRLPTEAEWEYAARAGTTTSYYWGETFNPAQCRYYGNAEQGVYTPGEKRYTIITARERVCNAFGLVDVLGNVKEWVQDSYAKSYVDAPRDGRAFERAGSGRVARGGSYLLGQNLCTVSYRVELDADRPVKDTGFRVAVSIPD